jgi:ubiquitin fusion degradation protein 1
MLFRVECMETGHHTHCGVLEFVADEGTVYMPYWVRLNDSCDMWLAPASRSTFCCVPQMMQNLCLEVGQMVKFSNVSLPKGQYVKLQPSTSDFLDISNPKAVLERALRSYSCLTKADCFVIEYNNKKYEIEVKETRPGDAISVIETDCQVDFEAPKDYKEPERFPAPAPQPMQSRCLLLLSHRAALRCAGTCGSFPAVRCWNVRQRGHSLRLLCCAVLCCAVPCCHAPLGMPRRAALCAGVCTGAF